MKQKRAKSILELYGYYEPYLKELGKRDIGAVPTLKELHMPGSVVQQAYREMQRMDFKGTIVDYLCWISTQYIGLLWKKQVQRAGAEGGAPERIVDLVNGIVDENPEDGRNFLKLFVKSPNHLIASDGYQSVRATAVAQPEANEELAVRDFDALSWDRLSKKYGTIYFEDAGREGK